MSSSKLEDNTQRALTAATRYVRAGVRSTREALTYLQRRGVPGDLARRTVAAFHARGVLDDRACARLWAEHWARAGYAWSAIRRRLADKGLDEHTIEHAAAQWGRASDDDARARFVAAQHARRGVGPRQRTRVARALSSRGFESDLIERVLNESFGPTPSDAER